MLACWFFRPSSDSSSCFIIYQHVRPVRWNNETEKLPCCQVAFSNVSVCITMLGAVHYETQKIFFDAKNLEEVTIMS